MPSAQLVDLKGKKLAEVTLDDSVFGGEPNTHVLHTALVRQLANARAGTACSKTRSEVRGGGRKPWRQKGTGRARAGSIRSPLWAGGGVIFGPRPRDYYSSMPKKMRQLALKSALAARANDLVVVKDFSDLKEAKTKAMAAVLKALELAGKKVLLVLDRASAQFEQLERAARNIAGVKVLEVNNLNVKDLLESDAVLTSEQALDLINNRFKQTPADESAPAKAPAKKSKAKAEKSDEAAENKEEKVAKAPKTPAKKKAEESEAEAAPEAPARKKKDSAES